MDSQTINTVAAAMRDLESQPSPNACRWCDVDRESHLQRWAPGVGWHVWVEPTTEQRKERMLKRRRRDVEGSAA